ncbi:MAG TPA: hypothetical protein VK503_00585 [Candidatus Bathyarchaeia archaeon]|nr:hypothetical protein [Candidatus Bathyarchaeia archaeon]
MVIIADRQIRYFRLKGETDEPEITIENLIKSLGMNYKWVKENKSDVRIVGVTPKLGVAIQGLRNPKEPFPTQLFRRE